MTPVTYPDRNATVNVKSLSVGFGFHAKSHVIDLTPDGATPETAGIFALRIAMPVTAATIALLHRVTLMSFTSRCATLAAHGYVVLRGKNPLVVVLHNTGTVAHLDDHQIQSAMSEFLTPEIHTDLSAIAVVETGRPGNRFFERALRGLRKGKGRDRVPHLTYRLPSHDELMEGLNVIDEENKAWRRTLTEEHPYLHVYHNYYARLPLPPKTFPGPGAKHALLRPEKRDRKFFALQKMKP
jgi:hypothetical protein